MGDLARILRVHVRTVQAWHKEGLSPNNPNERPLLFKGEVVQAFLTKRRDKGRHLLRPGEFYCTRCHKPRVPQPGTVTFEVTNRRVGKDALQVIIRASCQACGCAVNLFSTDKYLNIQREKMKTAQQQRGLKCEQLGLVFTDFERTGVGETK